MARKLSESERRLLKPVSGTTILGLGILLIAAPAALNDLRVALVLLVGSIGFAWWVDWLRKPAHGQTMSRVLIITLLLSVAATAQARGPVRASEGNTRGWQLMTPEERIEHQSKIRGFRTYEECRSYQVAHHQLMEERARARGMALPQGRRDICEHLQPASDSRQPSG